MVMENEAHAVSSASTWYWSNKTPSTLNVLSRVSKAGLMDLPSSWLNYATNSTRSCIQLKVPRRRLESTCNDRSILERSEVNSVNPGICGYLISMNLVKSRYTNGIPISKPSQKLMKNPRQLVQLILVVTMRPAPGVEPLPILKWNSLYSVGSHHRHYLPVSSRYLSLHQA